MTVIGLQSVESDNVAWVLLENCDFPGGKELITTDVFSQKDLKKYEPI